MRTNQTYVLTLNKVLDGKVITTYDEKSKSKSSKSTFEQGKSSIRDFENNLK